MKVVHLTKSYFGGAGIAAFRLHQKLVKIGVQSDFLCADYSSIEEGVHLYRYLDSINWKRKIINRFFNRFEQAENWQQRLQDLGGDFEILSIPVSPFDLHLHPLVQQANIVHLHWLGDWVDYRIFFNALRKKPIVWTLHDMNPFMGLFHYKGDKLRNSDKFQKLDINTRKIKQDIIRQQKKLCVVSPSSWLLDEAKESKFYTGETKFAVIPNLLNMRVFAPKSTTRTRTELSVKEDNTLFLFVSQSINNKRKGFDLLLEALKKIPDNTISLLVIGNSEGFSEVNQELIFLSEIHCEHDLAMYYSMADAFVLPSREDNLPNVMLESFACGTPVISFDVGGMSEYVREGLTGLKATSLDGSSLAATMQKFINERHLYKRQTIRSFAIDNFDESKVASSYHTLYEKLLDD